MQKIAKFEKVSFEQFNTDFKKIFGGIYDTTGIYKGIALPKRATVGSAGYDFFLPIDFELSVGETITIPTGVRVDIQNDWVLQIFPRSSLGFKFSLVLNNTVGIIDSDYYNSDNQGHIMIKMTNSSPEGHRLTLKAGSAFAQGLFVQYGITVDDDVLAKRNGGFGSTNISN